MCYWMQWTFRAPEIRRFGGIRVGFFHAQADDMIGIHPPPSPPLLVILSRWMVLHAPQEHVRDSQSEATLGNTSTQGRCVE